MSFRAAASLSAILACLGTGACTPSTPAAQEPPPGGTILAPPPASAAPAASESTAPPPAAPPQKMCGGIAGLQCPAKQYCSFAPEAHCGAADMSGTCAAVPDVCPQVVDEVCGCDDKTYGNGCMAAQAGVSVGMKGACAKPPAEALPEGALCGTRGVSQECAADLYCAFKSDCGNTDAGGSCSKKPQVCTKIYMPVCGCDGKTYGNACSAAATGISVASKGECKKK